MISSQLSAAGTAAALLRKPPAHLFHLCTLAVLLILQTGCRAAAPAKRAVPDPEAVNVLLLAWDGTNRNDLIALLQAGRLPNLQQIAAEGAVLPIDVQPGASTDTKAGFREILTGYGPDVTGVHSLTRFRPIPSGLTIFERVKLHFGETEVATALITGKNLNTGTFAPAQPPLPVLLPPLLACLREPQRAEYQRRLERLFKSGSSNPGQLLLILEQMRSRLAPNRAGDFKRQHGLVVNAFVNRSGGPFFNTRSALDVHAGNAGRGRRAVSAAGLKFLRQRGAGRFFALVHYASPDAEGHRFGADSAEYSAALEALDLELGRFITALKKLGRYEDTLLYVVSDHGFHGRSHAAAPHTFLAANDPGIHGHGSRLSIAPTIYQRFGIDPAKLRPPLPGQSLLAGSWNAALETHSENSPCTDMHDLPNQIRCVASEVRRAKRPAACDALAHAGLQRLCRKRALKPLGGKIFEFYQVPRQ